MRPPTSLSPARLPRRSPLETAFFGAAAFGLSVLCSPVADAHGCHGRERHPHAFARLLSGGGISDYPGLTTAFKQSTISTPEMFAHTCVDGNLEPPPGWISADGHSHYESCDGVLPDPQRLYFDASCLGRQFMAPRDVQISSALLWATGVIDLEPFSIPGVFLEGGACIEVGNTEVVYRKQWEGYNGPAGRVPGAIDALTGDATSDFLGYAPYGIPARERVVQTGIEVSGWDAGYFGHVAALNVTAAGGDLFERYPELSQKVGCAPLFDGDAAAHPELAEKFDYHAYLKLFECSSGLAPFRNGGHRNDGTGNWPGPLLEIFQRDEGVVTGYMHQYWPVDTVVSDDDYGPGVGWDWFGVLGADYAEREVKCFPTDLRAAFPDNFEGGNLNWPVFAAPDIAAGWIDFLEAQDMERRNSNPFTVPTTYTCGGTAKIACGEEDHHRTPPDSWFGMYYKLLTAGVSTSISAGSDGTCDTNCVPRTWVRVDTPSNGDPSQAYDDYTSALAAGRVTLSTEGYHFLDFEVNGVPIGGRVALDGPSTVDASVTYSMLPSLANPQIPGGFFDLDNPHFAPDDRVLQIIHNGQIIASVKIDPEDLVNGTGIFTLKNLPISESGWIAARTRSTSAHTGATQVIVADEPIANCLEAEYWMIYCDYVQSKIDAYADCQVQVGPNGESVFVPEFLEQYVGCSRTEIEARLKEARGVFRSLRDYAIGDPDGVCRTGSKQTSDCRDPLALVIGGDIAADAGEELRISAIHAPPDAPGVLLVGSTNGGVQPAAEPPYFLPDLAVLAVTSTHGGHHELATTAGLGSLGGIHLQYVWFDPEPCPGESGFTWTEAVTITSPSGAPITCP